MHQIIIKQKGRKQALIKRARFIIIRALFCFLVFEELIQTGHYLFNSS